MGIHLGDTFPNFEANTTEGKIKFHDWLGDSWGILFSHPADYTPVCTTELGVMAKMAAEFEKRKVKLIALSVDSVHDHEGWSQQPSSGDLNLVHFNVLEASGTPGHLSSDINAYIKKAPEKKLPFPIIADEKRDLAVQFGMLDPAERNKEGLPLTARAVFIIGPDKKMKLSILYPATTGRNFDEILRVVDSLQLTACKKVATPVNWKVGGECMILPNISPEDAAQLFPNYRTEDLPSGKTYMRFTTQP